MKRTAIIAVSVLLALVASGCNNIELTPPDMGAYRSQFAAGRTEYPSNPTLTNWGLASGNISGTVTASTESELVINFSSTPDLTTTAISLDLLKYSSLEEFGPKLKEAVKISAYSDLGSGTTPGATSPLTYTVTKWEYPNATIKLTPGTIAAVEVALDPEKWTHHGGMRLDLDGDGVIDEYDTKIFSYGSASPVVRNPRHGYYNAAITVTSSVVNTAATLTIPASTGIGSLTADVSAKFNGIFGVEKFNRESMSWERVETTGTNNNGAVDFAVSGADRDVFRLVVRDWGKAKEFRTEGSYYGYKQKIAPALGSPTVVLNSSTTVLFAANTTLVGNTSPFSEHNVYSYPGSGKKVEVTVQVTASDGQIIEGKGLPDPADAVKNGYIRLGYTDSSLGSPPTDWDTIKFINIEKAEAVKIVSTTAFDGWKLTLAPDYKNGVSTASGNAPYLFISPDVKTLGKDDGTVVKTFGNYGNVGYVKGKVNQYEAYAIGSASF